MRRIRAVWDRERTSVKNKTPAHCFMAELGPRLGPKTSLGPTPTSPVATTPAVVLRGGEICSLA